MISPAKAPASAPFNRRGNGGLSDLPGADSQEVLTEPGLSVGLRALWNVRSLLCQDGGGIWGLTGALVATERQENSNTFMMTPSKIMGNN